MYAFSGEQNRDVMGYIATRFDDFRRSLSDVRQDMADWFTKQYHEQQAKAQSHAVRAFKDRVHQLFGNDGIRYLPTINDVQLADPEMARWVMAHPQLRQLYKDEQIVGYGDGYENVHPEGVGPTHYDYRRVTEGVVMRDEDRGDHYVNNYIEKFHTGDKTLSIREKDDILSTWGIVDDHLSDADDLTDPTSIWNDQIG